MPWVWGVTQLDSSGKVRPLVKGDTAQIYPTYYIYTNRIHTQTVTAGDIEPFIALSAASVYQAP